MSALLTFKVLHEVVRTIKVTHTSVIALKQQQLMKDDKVTVVTTG